VQSRAREGRGKRIKIKSFPPLSLAPLQAGKKRKGCGEGNFLPTPACAFGAKILKQQGSERPPFGGRERYIIKALFQK